MNGLSVALQPNATMAGVVSTAARFGCMHHSDLFLCNFPCCCFRLVHPSSTTYYLPLLSSLSTIILITLPHLFILHLIVAVVHHPSPLPAHCAVPEGFSLPNIFNPVTDRADGRKEAKALVNLVAKEPKVAMGVGFQDEAPIEDTWNGEEDAEGMATVAQKKMMKEVESLENLIAQGKKIIKAMPIKQKRLALLKHSLKTILDAKAKREASEKLDQQQALLNAIKKREEAMATRLNALRKSQEKLQGSVGKLKSVIDGDKDKKPAAKEAKKARFAQLGLDDTAQAELGAQFMEPFLNAEAMSDADMEYAAAEAYAQL